MTQHPPSHHLDLQRTVGPIPRLLLRPSEAAESLGISERSLWSLTEDGTIPAVRLGRSVRYDLAALRERIASLGAGVPQ